jgi:hypothetical protein
MKSDQVGAMLRAMDSEAHWSLGIASFPAPWALVPGHS